VACNRLLMALLVMVLVACQQSNTETITAANTESSTGSNTGSIARANPDADRLQLLINEYVEQHRPGAAAAEQTDFSTAGFEAEISAQKKYLQQLLGIDNSRLNPQQDIDRRLLIGITSSDINTAEAQRRWENDASLYLPSAQLGRLLQADYSGAADQRMTQLGELLAALPQRLQSGQANLQNPPLRFTEAAIFQAESTLQALLDAQELLAGLDADNQVNAASARQALADYLQFLRDDLLPRSDGQWMLGRAAYEFILQNRWHMDVTTEQILQRGWSAFDETEALAQQVAENIQAGAHWTAVYESLKDEHPPADAIKQAYQQQMDAAQQFVRQHSVVTLPLGEQVITLDTPPALRRSSPFGTFQVADPFDGGLEGRLYLTPIEDWMTPQQQAERLRSHHTAWIPIIAVHEAYPGHHVQALVVNQNPNVLRRIIREPIFSEGWGLFTEELMFEQGFLQGDDVRLTQLRNRLWRAARVILDVSLHTGQMSFDAAVDFLVEKVRFERYAAELEVGMYIRRPTYVLGYLIGMQEITAIRAEYIDRFGEPQPASKFYDRLLYIGAIPPALLREELFASERSAVDHQH
jgi:uncharacterized protein (DUF885 family)